MKGQWRSGGRRKWMEEREEPVFVVHGEVNKEEEGNGEEKRGKRKVCEVMVKSF